MRICVWVVVAGLWLAPMASAQGVKLQIGKAVVKPTAEAKQAQDDAATKRIKQILKAKKVSFDFAETPFSDALSFIQALLDVNIVVDPKVKAKQTLTLTVKDMNVGAALQWLLRLGGAKMEIKEGAIYVAPAPKADAVRPKVGWQQVRRHRRMIGRAEIKVGDLANVQLYLYEDDLPEETREMLLKLLRVSLEAEMQALAKDDAPAKKK